MGPSAIQTVLPKFLKGFIVSKVNSETYDICVCVCVCMYGSHESSVGIALGYGLYDRGSRVRFPAGAGNFSLHHRVQNSSGAHPASYPMRNGGSFPGCKAAGA
jgi:hypothetical protein